MCMPCICRRKNAKSVKPLDLSLRARYQAFVTESRRTATGYADDGQVFA